MPPTKRPPKRRKRRPPLTDEFYQRMIRNPDRRIPFVLVERS